MKTREARELGQQTAARVIAGEIEEAYTRLAPVLARRTPFAKLDLIGEALGAGPTTEVYTFLEKIAAERTMGGWVIMAAALGTLVDHDLAGVFEHCHRYILLADVWYATDIFGERVTGPTLLSAFQPALTLLAPWREDPNRWVRRNVGVAVHFWAKRSRGAPEEIRKAEALLSFLKPMFTEGTLDAVKGVGWGLKTLGRHYPDLLANWLAEEIVPAERQHRALMLRKALTYLSAAQRARAVGDKM